MAVLKKELLKKCYCSRNSCSEKVTVVLKWNKVLSPKTKLLKKSQHMGERKSPFEKNFLEIFPHSDEYSWGISYEYLTGWPKPTEEVIVRLSLYHTIFRIFKGVYHKQKNCVDSCFWQLIFFLRGLFLHLIQLSLFKIPCKV